MITAGLLAAGRPHRGDRWGSGRGSLPLLLLQNGLVLLEVKAVQVHPVRGPSYTTTLRGGFVVDSQSQRPHQDTSRGGGWGVGILRTQNKWFEIFSSVSPKSRWDPGGRASQLEICFRNLASADHMLCAQANWHTPPSLCRAHIPSLRRLGGGVR